MPELDLGNVKGPQGKSAYQSALDAGYSGSEEAFNTAMAKAPDAVLYTAQSLTDEQKAQARTNIGAANKETQEKVLTTTTPSRTVTVAAAELPAYINALPRLLNEALTINISSGTVPEGLKINGFYGNGRLNLQPANGASVQIPHGIYITYCTAYIYLSNLTVSGEGYVAGADSALIFVRTANVGISQCTITGNDSNYGVIIAYQSIGHINSCNITHTSYAVQVFASSIGGVHNCTGSNNRIGILAAYGAAAMLSGTTPELMGGTTNDKQGPIFKGSTLL